MDATSQATNSAGPPQEEITSLRKAVEAIAPVPASDFDLLLPLLHRKTYGKGDYLLREGEASRHVFFLLTGLVRMYYLDFNGNDISYRFTHPAGFFVDFASLLTQQPSRYYWQALKDTEVLAIAYTDVQRLYASSPAWNNFGRLLAERVYLQLNERVEMLLLLKPEERYLHVLAHQPELFSQVSQIHLSSYLGMKPESLSRIRSRVRRK